MPQERNVSNLEGPEFVWRSKKAILPKRVNFADFEIAAKSATRSFDCQTRKPANDFLQASFADNCRSVGDAVIRKAAGRLTDKLDCETEEVGEPSANIIRLAEHKGLF